MKSKESKVLGVALCSHLLTSRRRIIDHLSDRFFKGPSSTAVDQIWSWRIS